MNEDIKQEVNVIDEFEVDVCGLSRYRMLPGYLKQRDDQRKDLEESEESVENEQE